MGLEIARKRGGHDLPHQKSQAATDYTLLRVQKFYMVNFAIKYIYLSIYLILYLLKNNAVSEIDRDFLSTSYISKTPYNTVQQFCLPILEMNTGT